MHQAIGLRRISDVCAHSFTHTALLQAMSEACNVVLQIVCHFYTISHVLKFLVLYVNSELSNLAFMNILFNNYQKIQRPKHNRKLNQALILVKST